MLLADIADFLPHRSHDFLTADVTEPALNGYWRTVRCACGGDQESSSPGPASSFEWRDVPLRGSSCRTARASYHRCSLVHHHVSPQKSSLIMLLQRCAGACRQTGASPRPVGP